MARSPADPRRWIRHGRNLQGFNQVWDPTGNDPNAPHLIAPWLSDYIQLVTEVPPSLPNVIVTDPAAGVNWARIVNGGENWKLLSCAFTLATDANVANRTVRVQLLDRAGRVVFATHHQTLQTATQTRRYFLSAGPYDIGAPATSSFRSLPIPSPLWMPQGFSIGTTVVGLQVGDQFSLIDLFIEGWPG